MKNPFLPAVIAISALVAMACSQKAEVIPQTQIKEKIRDFAGVLNTNQEEHIYRLIQSLEQEAGTAVAVITIDSLMGESISSFARRKAKELGLNQDKERLLIAVSVQNKEIYISAGGNLNTILKEEDTHKIIREHMAPRFRKNRYGSGIFVAVSKMKNIIKENREDAGLFMATSHNNSAIIARR